MISKHFAISTQESKMTSKLIILQVILTLFFGFFVQKTLAATVDEQEFAELSTQLNLGPQTADEVLKVLEKAPKKSKGRVFFCVNVGASVVIDHLVLGCRNLRGDTVDVSFIGLGLSLSAHAGVAVLYPKKGSRMLNEGTYRNSDYAAIHAGIGLNGMNFQNDNQSIDYRIRGITVGAGINRSFGLILVRNFVKNSKSI